MASTSVTRPAPGRRRRWVRRARVGVFGAGIATLAILVGSIIFVRATARGAIYAEADVPAAPVGLVLGAQVYPDGTPSPFLAARLDLAHRLFDAGKIRAILVSGDNGTRVYNEPAAMRTYLILAGVPPAKVVADFAGFDTYDSCVRAREIFGVHDLVMITQSYHLPRAVATCLSVGVHTVGVGDDSVRTFGGSWRKGAIRDQIACVKTVWDLVSQREPTLGPYEVGIDGALRRP